MIHPNLFLKKLQVNRKLLDYYLVFSLILIIFLPSSSSAPSLDALTEIAKYSFAIFVCLIV
jgi:hypothetical protein